MVEQRGERDVVDVGLDRSIPLRNIDGLVELSGKKADRADTL